MPLKVPLYCQRKFRFPDDSSGSNFDPDIQHSQHIEVSSHSIAESVAIEYMSIQSQTDKGDTIVRDQVTAMAAKLLDLEHQNNQLKEELDELQNIKRIYIFL